MAKRIATKKEAKKAVTTPYRSAVCGLGNAVTVANEWSEEGYDIKWCLAVVADDAEGKPTQALYLLGVKRAV